ncbi:hypothetical protein FBQ99_20380 [Chloroflexi bacterium CFX2]|nr:hypothetical protein [Chloroflexi bacterium CFX2]
MKHYSALNWLIPLIILIAALTASVGLFSQGGDGPFMFTTLHGQTVQIYGKGLYRFDTVLSAATFKGVDVITLGLSIPLLMVAFILYRRNSLRGGLLLIGAIPYFLYIGASMTFSAAFNRIFLLYAALLSVSLFAFIVALTTIDLAALSKHILRRLPQRGIAIFMFVAGIGTFLLWLSELIGPMLTGATPANLGPYTTMYTHGFDSAVITPATVLTGIFLLQRKPLGYLFAAPLLVFCTQNGFTVMAATISQALEGIAFPIGVYIGMVGSWVLMGAFAIGLTIQYFRNISEVAQ